jgi:MFS superfamily sulfate permease-like transporter
MEQETRKQTIDKLNPKTTPAEATIKYKKTFFLATVIVCLFGWTQWVRAQDYPTRPITLLISYAPGAATDRDKLAAVRSPGWKSPATG